MTFLKQFLWSVFVMFWFFYWIFVPKILLLEADHQASLRHGPSILGMSWGSHIQDEKVTTKNIFNLKKTFWRFGPFTPKFLDCLFWTFLVAPPFLVSKKGISRLIITTAILLRDRCCEVTETSTTSAMAPFRNAAVLMAPLFLAAVQGAGPPCPSGCKCTKGCLNFN